MYVYIYITYIFNVVYIIYVYLYVYEYIGSIRIVKRDITDIIALSKLVLLST